AVAVVGGRVEVRGRVDPMLVHNGEQVCEVVAGDGGGCGCRGGAVGGRGGDGGREGSGTRHATRTSPRRGDDTSSRRVSARRRRARRRTASERAESESLPQSVECPE